MGSLSSFNRRLNLQTRIVVCISALVLIGVLVTNLAAIYVFRGNLIAQVLNEEKNLVEHLSQNLDANIQILRSALIAVAGIAPPDLVSNPDKAQAFLDANKPLRTLFDRSLFIFSPEGVLIAESPYRPNRRGQNFAFRDYIKETLRTKQPAISAPFLTTKGDSNVVLMLTAPVMENGEIKFIVTGSLGLTQPRYLGNIANTKIGKTGYLYLMTGDGVMVMHPDRSQLMQQSPRPNPNPQLEVALQGQNTFGEIESSNGKKMLTALHHMPLTGWILAADYPLNDALSPFLSAATRINLIFLAVTAILLVVVWLLVRSFFRPLYQLTHLVEQQDIRSIDSFSKGNILGPEIGKLAKAFSDMLGLLKSREDALQDSMRRFQLLAENTTDLICRLSYDGAFTYVSPVSETLLGYHPENLVHHSIFDLVHPQDIDNVRNAINFSEIKDSSVSYRICHQNQSYVWVESSFRVIDNDKDEGIACVTRDITERRQVEENLNYIARHDALTGLPNRLSLTEQINQAISKVTRLGGCFALVMFDLDRFKFINDTIGHGAGDELLCEAALRLQKVIRKTDLLARWGGDEFVLLLRDIADVENAKNITQKCLNVLAEPIGVQGSWLHIRASAGIALYPEAGTTENELLRSADMAMYRVKEMGGGQAIMFSADLSERTRLRMSTENDLHEALKLGLLELHYQPIISANTQRVEAVEALLRWRHPSGYVGPDLFIPIAEDTGLIVPIGKWVLEEASRFAKELIDTKLVNENFTISVNVSARQFREENFLLSIDQIIKDINLDPKYLQLELTESALMSNPSLTESTMRSIRDMGIKIAIDDFGTGYSSLAYLARFPATCLKIDSSFVSRISGDGPETTIIKATIAMAHGLGMTITAEGVETEKQKNTLIELGCERLQGFLFDHALTAENLKERLATQIAYPNLRVV